MTLNRLFVEGKTKDEYHSFEIQYGPSSPFEWFYTASKRAKEVTNMFHLKSGAFRRCIVT